MGPVVGFIGVISTFFAFWVQYVANQKQFRQFKKQNKDIKLERFENKFYELIKIHRDNVNEFEIPKFKSNGILKGRRVFVEMFTELNVIYNVVERLRTELISEDAIGQEEFSDENVFNVAYAVFFNGLPSIPLLSGNPNDLGEYKMFPDKYNLMLHQTFTKLEELRRNYITTQESYMFQIGINNVVFLYPKITYKLFCGHNSRLGHYFRGLFQLVSFVVEYNSEIVKNKYSYVKIIRAQLSNHEQLLLYYNALSYLGKPWIEKKYLNEWRMIKNIPLYMANFYLTPEKKFGKINSVGKFIFEIDEIASRL